VPAIRQGDFLFNAGFFDQAREFYMRLLGSDSSFGDAMELQYKIGACFLRRREFSQARFWLEKVILLPDSDFWALQARWAMAEADMREGKMQDLAEKVSRCSPKPELYEGIRVILAEEWERLFSLAFYAEALRIAQLSLESEQKALPYGPLAQQRLASSLVEMRDYALAEAWLQRILEAGDLAESILIQCLIDLSRLYSLQGRWQESDQAIDRIRKLSVNQHISARCDILQSYNLRGKAKFAEAIEFLASIPKRFPMAKQHFNFIGLSISELLLITGKAEEAKKKMASCPSSGTKEMLEYVPWLLEKNFLKAGDVVGGCLEQKGGVPAIRAEQGIKAGVLFELAGQKERARAIWSGVARRYPEVQCHFYGELAKALTSPPASPSPQGRGGTASKAIALLEEMPYSTAVRTEMFYLVGLLHESRGNQDRAGHLFRLAAEEEKTNRWPAVMAQRKLEAEEGIAKRRIVKDPAR
jgi:tetratricopeptide (TPR) repeat protein